MKPELENAKCLILLRFEQWFGGGELLEVLASGPHHEFANATSRVVRCAGILWRETLVRMCVPVKHEIGTRCVEVLPKGGDLSVIAHAVGGVPRVMPVRDRASRRVRRKIVAQPCLLRRADAATTDERAVRIERD